MAIYGKMPFRAGITWVFTMIQEAENRMGLYGFRQKADEMYGLFFENMGFRSRKKTRMIDNDRVV